MSTSNSAWLMGDLDRSPPSDERSVHEEKGLEVGQKRREGEQPADDAQPDHALDKVRIDAEEAAGNHRNELHLPFPVDEIPHADGAGDQADEKAGRAQVVTPCDEDCGPRRIDAACAGLAAMAGAPLSR